MAGKDTSGSSGSAGPGRSNSAGGNGAEGLDPEKAIRFKEEGNKCFGRGEWNEAETWYVRAVQADPTNHALYTNHSLTLLKLHSYSAAIIAAGNALRLQPESFKAYHHIAQAQLALEAYDEALRNAERAHELCIEEIKRENKGTGSLGAITDVVLKALRGRWLDGEKTREVETRRRKALESEILNMIREQGGEADEVAQKIQDVTSVFAEKAEEQSSKRRAPDWVVDDISFNPMIDPVMTKTGNTYERASILKHLERSQTDPLTREPLTAQDLRPNLALKAVCREFLMQNGWAIDE